MEDLFCGEVVVLPEIQGDGFLLRPYQESDAVSLQQALNDPLVYERLTNIPRPYTLVHAQQWIAQSVTEVSLETKRISFAIIIDGEVAGSVAFINVNMQQNNAQISTWVAQRFWGQGLATKAIELLLQFGFQKLALYRVFAFYVEDNVKSKKMLARLGFRKEGKHRKEWKKEINGREVRLDSVHCSLLLPEWEESR